MIIDPIYEQGIQDGSFDAAPTGWSRTSEKEEPYYYDKGGIKTIDIIRAKMPDHFTAFQAGLYWNVLKYALRAPYKEQLHSDLDKLIDYAQKLKAET